MNFFQHKTELPGIQPDTLFSVGSVPISNAMLLGILVTLGVALTAFFIKKTAKLKPTKFQTAMEIIIQAFFDQCVQILHSKKTAAKLLPLVGTIFVFFGVSNLITLIPGITSFTYDGMTMFRTPTNDFNMTFSVALAILLLTQYASIRKFGIFRHLGKFLKVKEIVVGFKQGFGKGMLAIVNFFLGLLDILSEIAKAFSLSLRLFGNMFAGDILAALLLGAFALVVPAVLVGFNLLVGVIQALVFGVLAAAYYHLAVVDDEATEEVHD